MTRIRQVMNALSNFKGRGLDRRLFSASLASLAIVASACGSSTAANTGGTKVARSVKPAVTTTFPLALTGSEASWQLENPLSRMVLLPAGSGSLAILGGLTAADTSASGIFRLKLSDGSLTAIGTLPAAVHDAAGAVIGSNYLVFGGGSVNTVASVETAPVAGGNGKVISNLPQPRSDCTATTVGGEAIIVGGYNGSTADASVLATRDALSYKSVSSLKVPVRYAALATLGDSVYVFGGLEVGGPGSGQPSDAVQRIDLATGSTTVVGSLPIPLEGAMAFVLNGHIYLAGGDTGSGSNLKSNAAVWTFQSKAGFKVVATLPFAVSNAGVAVTGGAAWIVGGEHNGRTTAVVQTLKAG